MKKFLIFMMICILTVLSFASYRYIQIAQLPDKKYYELEDGYKHIRDIFKASDTIVIGEFTGQREVIDYKPQMKNRKASVRELDAFQVSDVLKGTVEEEEVLWIYQEFFTDDMLEKNKGIKPEFESVKEVFPNECVLFLEEIEEGVKITYFLTNSDQAIIKIKDSKLDLEYNSQIIYMWVYNIDHLKKKLSKFE